MRQEQTSVADRRASPRFPHKSQAQLVLCPASRRKARANVNVVDYSIAGIGITHDEPLAVGQKYIVIEPFITRGGSTIYTVVRCDQMADGRYSVGLQMVAAVRDPVVQMMDEFVPVEEGAGVGGGFGFKRLFAGLLGR